ncbi:MAG: hypothetical protein K8F92_03055 [Hyphomicrobium sp.]|uniref:hypothetical protein n=1 Tax=Hyphomicrobium sp. TaxID=82 RepID=UPI0025BA17C1|nr:hypothetical protein [Hyphomicrobium sp.]MBZ0208620.1 hypothetical protein [Hyphomicrobium sp.]
MLLSIRAGIASTGDTISSPWQRHLFCLRDLPDTGPAKMRHHGNDNLILVMVARGGLT